MLFVFSQCQTFYYSLEPGFHWTVVGLWNRWNSSLSKERLIKIERNIDRVSFKFLKTWCRGLGYALVVWFRSPTAVLSKSGIKTIIFLLHNPFVICKLGMVREQKAEYSISLKVNVVLFLGL